MADRAIAGPDWIGPFLEELERTGMVKLAVAAAGVTHGAVYAQRRRNSAFDTAWSKALGKRKDAGEASPNGNMLPMVTVMAASNAGWKTAFLENLAASSNVSASAAAVNVPLATVYRTRRKEPAFAESWRQALFEGYEHLELEVLAHLRGQHTGRPIDIANAIRQLAAHGKTIREMRSLEADIDETEVLDSIDALIERIRVEKEQDEQENNPNG